MNSRVQKTAVLLAAIFWSLSASALPVYTGMVVIGDSLSDQGNVSLITGGFVPPAEYTDGTTSGRFTNGRNYIDYLSASLGLELTPSIAGGSNYATGGARTDSASIGGVPIGPFSLLDQRDSYIGSLGPSGAAPGALHVVWGGSNDLTDIVEAVLADPSLDPLPRLQTVITNMADIVASLAAAKATDILIPNVPNLGLVPLITGGGSPVAEATALSAAFNSGLATAMAELATVFPDTNLMEFDAFGLLTGAYLDPAAFGFTNVTDGCYSKLALPGGTVCGDPAGYLSWDGFHPTTVTHRILAAAMSRSASEPATLLLLVVGLTGVSLARRRTFPG